MSDDNTGRLSRAGAPVGRVGQMLGLARRTLLFTMVPALSIVSPLVVLPAVSSTHGAPGIAATAIGQSVGAVGGCVVGLAWPLRGPADIARSTPEQRARLYQQSIDTRILLLLIVAPVGVGAALLISTADPVVSGLMALAFVCAGLTSSWYFTGTGSARQLLLWEAVPRTLACLAAGGLLLIGLPLSVYPIALLLASSFTYVALCLKITGRITIDLRRSTRAEVRTQLRTTVSRFINGTYMTGGVSIVGLVAPGSLVLFAGYDRIQKSLFNMAVSFPTSLIAWVARTPAGLYRRQRVVFLVDALFCAALSVSCYFALPLAMNVVYAGVISTNKLTDLILSMSLGLMVFAQATVAHGLMPARLDQFAATLMTSCYAVGIGLTVLGAAFFGANGALSALVVTEMVVITFALTRVVTEGRRRAVEERPPSDITPPFTERTTGHDL
jgi:hypothetical protein